MTPGLGHAAALASCDPLTIATYSIPSVQQSGGVPALVMQGASCKFRFVSRLWPTGTTDVTDTTTRGHQPIMHHAALQFDGTFLENAHGISYFGAGPGVDGMFHSPPPQGPRQQRTLSPHTILTPFQEPIPKMAPTLHDLLVSPTGSPRNCRQT